MDRYEEGDVDYQIKMRRFWGLKKGWQWSKQLLITFIYSLSKPISG